ncbi:MAG: hypothetical protein EA384_04745 [Spirochaetaceae bacterium]|nr:MAG: hypothetical protein EA384_04745 [Spirochaetaceae bacterium]
MILFAIVAVPLACYVILHYTGERGPTIGPVVRGALWYAVGFPATIITEALLDLQYNASDLLRYFAIRDAYLPYVLGLLGFFLFYHRLAAEDDRAMVPAMTLFLAAFLTVFGLAQIMLDTGFLGVYRVLILPAHRVALMILTPLLVGVWIREVRVALRVLYALLLIVLPFLTAIAPALLALSQPVPGIAVAVLLTAAAVVVYLSLRSAYYPDRGLGGGGLSENTLRSGSRQSSLADEPGL